MRTIRTNQLRWSSSDDASDFVGLLLINACVVAVPCTVWRGGICGRASHTRFKNRVATVVMLRLKNSFIDGVRFYFVLHKKTRLIASYQQLVIILKCCKRLIFKTLF